MSPQHNIRIIGGGLAGLSLGIALSKSGVPTEISDTGIYPRHRVCGEFMAGLDDEVLRRLGISSVFDGARLHRHVTWSRHGRIILRQKLPTPVRAISRYLLDARLAGLYLASGGVLKCQTRVAQAQQDIGLVDASGRKPVGVSDWIGLKLHVRNLQADDDLEMHLGDGSYVGLTTVEDGWTNICGLFRRRHGLSINRAGALETYLLACGESHLVERMARAEVRSDSRCAVAGFSFTSRSQLDGRIRLGDASAVVPPFTGNGMAMAFKGAAIALGPLASWAAHERTWVSAIRSIGIALNSEFKLRLRCAGLIHPFLLNPSLQGGVELAGRARLIPFTTLYRLLH